MLAGETWGYRPYSGGLWLDLTGPSFPGCTCTFKDRFKLREHLRSHTQEKVVACPTCGGMFANNTKFLDHIRRQASLDRKRLKKGHRCRLSYLGWWLGARSQERGPLKVSAA